MLKNVENFESIDSSFLDVDIPWPWLLPPVESIDSSFLDVDIPSLSTSQ